MLFWQKSNLFLCMDWQIPMIEESRNKNLLRNTFDVLFLIFLNVFFNILIKLKPNFEFCFTIIKYIIFFRGFSYYSMKKIRFFAKKSQKTKSYNSGKNAISESETSPYMNNFWKKQFVISRYKLAKIRKY